MPSRAEARALREPPPGAAPVAPVAAASGPARARRGAEWVLRALAVALLGALLWRSLHPEAPPGGERAEGGDVGPALLRWAARPPGHARLRFDRLPSAAERDLALALRRAGTPVSWTADSLPALAVALSRVADPAGGAQVAVAAPPGARVEIRDAIGVLDSLGVRGAGGTLSLAAVAGLAGAETAGGGATAGAADSLLLRRILVLGHAGWEAKFTIAALEERGWAVDARLAVAPGVAVTQGAPAAPDTARYAAVVALDSTAASEAARIARYVRSGGGLVLGPEAARLTTLAALAPAAPGARVPGVAGALTGDEPRRGLALVPLRRLAPGAVPLERRDSLLALAARRVALGRVVQAGYEDTWRWRMGGGPDAVDAHRAWWARLVAGAAYAPVVRDTAAASVDSSGASSPDPAPRAALAAALGAPSTGAAAPARASRAAFGVATFAVLALLLLVEWGSRRARGAR